VYLFRIWSCISWKNLAEHVELSIFL